MDLEDKFLAKVSGVQSLSSSVQSTPEKNVHLEDVSRSSKLLFQERIMKTSLKKEYLLSGCDKKKKYSASSKWKMADQLTANGRPLKNQEARKASSGPSSRCFSRKQARKGDNPARLSVPPPSENSPDFCSSYSWICKNSACRATLSMDVTFCKRCSCCICHLFDDNKDPSLWLECTSESSQGHFCGLSCHIECALKHKKVGVVDLGQLMQLDGSYCCASCGKVSRILGNWKKQLLVARDARRVDALCYRLDLSYRLLEGTLRFRGLHDIVKDAKAKLETEVGPLDGVSAKTRGIVSRLSVGGDVQRLCSLAIEKADEWLANASNGNLNGGGDWLPAACRFLFEEVTSSSIVVVLIELLLHASPDIKGYKLWYSQSREQSYQEEPTRVFPKAQRRILISHLQPCTEYTFRVVSYTETGDLGHSEAKCFTKSVEIIPKAPEASVCPDKKDNRITEASSSGARAKTSGESHGFKVRDLSKILHLARAQENGRSMKPASLEDDSTPSSSRGLDLNVVSVPDLNEEVNPFESPREDAHDDAGSREIGKTRRTHLHGSGDSQTWTDGPPSGDAPAVESQTESCRKRTGEEAHDSDSTLVNGSPLRDSAGPGPLDENFEYCVKIIRWLECEGYIKHDFRLKLLTWFSLRSTDQERRVVHAFIQTLIDDPCSLAGQLVDSFSDFVSTKRPRNGFCSKLWH